MPVSVDDLYVRTWGQGAKVLLIHGSIAENPETHWLQQRDLATRYQIIIPHRRGYGQSPPPKSHNGHEENIHDIRLLSGEGVHLVGHSYGGLLAMVAATRYPQLVKSLTVIEPPAFSLAIKQPEVAQIVAALQRIYQTATTPEQFLTQFLRIMGNTIAHPPSLSPQHRKAVITTMKETEPWNIPLNPEILTSHPFPKLVVSGNWHPALTITSDILTHHLRADHLIIQGRGHEIQKVGKPFNDRLEALFALASRTS